MNYFPPRHVSRRSICMQTTQHSSSFDVTAPATAALVHSPSLSAKDTRPARTRQSVMICCQVINIYSEICILILGQTALSFGVVGHQNSNDTHDEETVSRGWPNRVSSFSSFFSSLLLHLPCPFCNKPLPPLGATLRYNLQGSAGAARL